MVGKSPWSHCLLQDKVDLAVRFCIWCALAVNTAYLRLWVVHRKLIHSIDAATGSVQREPTSSPATLHLQRASSPWKTFTPEWDNHPSLKIWESVLGTFGCQSQGVWSQIVGFNLPHVPFYLVLSQAGPKLSLSGRLGKAGALSWAHSMS